MNLSLRPTGNGFKPLWKKLILKEKTGGRRVVPGRDKLSQKWSFKIEPPIWRENA